jgi:hypothetical protein
MLERSASNLVDEAREESRLGHGLNAILLYTAAAGLASRGPFYHSEVQDQIQQEAAQIVPPAEFRSQPPFLLEGPSGLFRIVSLAPVSVDKRLYLLIAHVITLSDSGEVVQNNRDLMTAFAKRFPEYSHAFAGLVVKATGPDGSREWRTQRDNSQIAGAHTK